MKRKTILLALFLLPAFVQADAPILLNLPKSGAPITRIGGGTRGSNKAAFTLQALAPAQVGLTAQASPVLYWYVSNVLPYSVEFSLGEENGADFVVEKTWPPVTKPGVQSIKLSDLNVQLDAGKEYRWTVALIADPQQRAKDIITSATIRRENADIALNDTKQLAAAGLWYDLVQRLTEQKSPQLPDILKQVDIVLDK